MGIDVTDVNTGACRLRGVTENEEVSAVGQCRWVHEGHDWLVRRQDKGSRTAARRNRPNGALGRIENRTRAGPCGARAGFSLDECEIGSTAEVDGAQGPIRPTEPELPPVRRKEWCVHLRAVGNGGSLASDERLHPYIPNGTLPATKRNPQSVW